MSGIEERHSSRRATHLTCRRQILSPIACLPTLACSLFSLCTLVSGGLGASHPEEIEMSKHSIDEDVKGVFWKKMRYGAAAAVTLGSGIYAVSSVLKQQGLFSMVDEVKTAIHALPHRFEDRTPQQSPQPTADDDAEVEQMDPLTGRVSSLERVRGPCVLLW